MRKLVKETEEVLLEIKRGIEQGKTEDDILKNINQQYKAVLLGNYNHIYLKYLLPLEGLYLTSIVINDEKTDCNIVANLNKTAIMQYKKPEPKNTTDLQKYKIPDGEGNNKKNNNISIIGDGNTLFSHNRTIINKNVTNIVNGIDNIAPKDKEELKDALQKIIEILEKQPQSSKFPLFGHFINLFSDIKNLLGL